MNVRSYVSRTREAAALARLAASATRLTILTVLARARDGVCVKELAHAAGISHSAASHQLALLETRGIVKCRRRGKTMCYTLTHAPIAGRVRRFLEVFVV